MRNLLAGSGLFGHHLASKNEEVADPAVAAPQPEPEPKADPVPDTGSDEREQAAFQRGVTSERDRWTNIFASKHSVGRVALAASLAKSGLDSAAVIEALQVSPVEAAAGVSTARQNLIERRENHTPINVGIEPEASAVDKPAEGSVEEARAIAQANLKAAGIAIK